MGNSKAERDEPLTPAGRLFLRPDFHQIIHIIMGFKNPIDTDAVKSEITNSVMIKLPRFSSLIVRNSSGGEHWRKTQVDVDHHVIVIEDPVSDASAGDEEAVNDYVADLSVSSPLSSDKPLWEVHLLTAHNCMVFRIHHALADGISLMSMLQECCRRADRPNDQRLSTTGSVINSSLNKKNRMRELWKLVVGLFMNVVFIMEIMLRAFWVKDRRTVVSGGAGVELWPRKLATAKFRFDDMKQVKKAVADATINDVLSGIISSGLSRYLDMRSPKALRDGVQITGLTMVNLRKQPGLQELSKMIRGNSGIRWGNKFGTVLFPVYYRQGGGDPLQHVKTAKKMMDQKKHSLEAHFSYYFGMCCFGPKLSSWLSYRTVCNTTFTISNVVGLKEEITIAGNPVTYMRMNMTSIPHAISMHMLSYGGRADLQILVAKDIVPDPEVLAKCFEDALLQMKEAAAPKEFGK
ncbi:hypothetical protein Vadar_002422 [Vaccinium darrowii]|uniref:Uncharacterized protein n=1 Tax=Vaccinium darrowii TaxID=229202 RepID=A0ACB7WXB9_9ERIC|nr:hypothetical protein Vadar_002422 [Vaccinium darrowii]